MKVNLCVMHVGFTSNYMASIAHSPCEKMASRRENENRRSHPILEQMFLDLWRKKTCIIITITIIISMNSRRMLKRPEEQNFYYQQLQRVHRNFYLHLRRTSHRFHIIIIIIHLKHLILWQLHYRVSIHRQSLICNHRHRQPLHIQRLHHHISIHHH